MRLFPWILSGQTMKKHLLDDLFCVQKIDTEASKGKSQSLQSIHEKRKLLTQFNAQSLFIFLKHLALQP